MLCMFDIGRISLLDRYLTWQIRDFHALQLVVGCEVRSPQFVYGNSMYILAIWPRGQKGTGSEEWFGVCLYKHGARRSNESVKFSIVNGQGTFKTCTVNCSDHNIFMEAKFIEWADFVTFIHKIAPNGCLTIVCRLPVENHETGRNQNDNVTDMLSSPLSDPPVKYLSGDYHSPGTMPMMRSVKFENRGPSIPVFAAPGVFDHGSPSTINSFFSTLSCHDSFDVPESVATENANFKMPYNIHNDTIPETKLRSYFLGGLFRDSKRKQRDVVLDPVGDNPETSTSQPTGNSTTALPKNSNSSRSSSSSESNSIDSVRASSNIPLSENTPASSAGKEDYQRTAQHQSFPDSSSFQDFVTNSAANSYLTPQESVNTLSSAVHCPKGLKILSQDLKNIYLGGKDFDLTIIMEGKEFKVLRHILKGRSPIFKTMLSEDTSNIIPISPFDACDSSVFHDFLLYVYSGEIESLSHKNVYGLYSAACKFEMPDLKEQCVKFLKLSLSIDTVTDILRLVNDESDLLEIAIFYLAKNMEIIMETDEWKQFITEEPNRAVQYHLKALKIGYKKMIT